MSILAKADMEENEISESEQQPSTPGTAEEKPKGAASEAGAASSADASIEEGEVKEGLLRKLNPLRMFRKESASMYIKEGHNLAENHNLALATMAFQKAISLEPQNVEAHKGLGHVMMKKGGRTNMGAALTQFQEALRINPFDDKLYALTARILEKLGKMKEATLEKKKMMVVKTLQSDPKNPIANNNMGILMMQAGDLTKALEYFKQSVASNPNYDVAFRNLAAAYYQMAMKEPTPEKKSDHVESATGYIKKAISIDDTVPSKIILGKILVLGGSYDEALAICGQAEEQDPTNRSVYMLKRIVYEKMNRTADAQAAYDSFVSMGDEG